MQVVNKKKKTYSTSLIIRKIPVREFGINIYTPQYFKWITNKDLLWSTGDSAPCDAAAWMGGEFGGEWTRA